MLDPRKQINKMLPRLQRCCGYCVHFQGPGKGKIIEQITFPNGAVKWAFIDKDRAVLMW